MQNLINVYILMLPIPMLSSNMYSKKAISISLIVPALGPR